MVYGTREIDNSPVAIVAIDGKLDNRYVPLVQGLIDRGRTWVLCNLERSTAIRGDHMEWMIETHHACEREGGAYALTDVPKDFAYILSIMQLDQFFRVFDTEEEGVATFVEAARKSVASGLSSSAELLELALPAPSPKMTRRERAKLAEVEREQRVEMFVKHVAPGMSYLRVFELLAKAFKAGSKSRKIDPAALASESTLSKGEVTRILKHLTELRICTCEDGDYTYAPGTVAEADVADFLRLWSAPAKRTKLRKLVFVEEQRARRQGGVTGFIRRLFGGE